MSTALSFWAEINRYRDANSENRFQGLSDSTLSFLVLPHSHVETERILTQMNLLKTKLRNRKQFRKLFSILAIRYGLTRHNESCYNMKLFLKLLNNLKIIKTYADMEIENSENILQFSNNK